MISFDNLNSFVSIWLSNGSVVCASNGFPKKAFTEAMTLCPCFPVVTRPTLLPNSCCLCSFPFDMHFVNGLLNGIHPFLQISYLNVGYGLKPFSGFPYLFCPLRMLPVVGVPKKLLAFSNMAPAKGNVFFLCNFLTFVYHLFTQFGIGGKSRKIFQNRRIR